MNKTLSMLCVAWCGCGSVAESPAANAAPLTSCEVTLPAMPVRVVANDTELLVGLDDGTLLRGAGDGCALRFERSGDLGVLLDVDATGSAYVMISDALRQLWFTDTFGDLVARVTPGGDASRVVSAGRGIWGFGVAPSGKAMWVSACGPTGVLSTADLSPLIDATPPWEPGTALLTDDTTYWSTRAERCTERGSECTLAVVRATPAGEERLATMDISLGFTPLLARCGEGVCVSSENGVRQLRDDGALLREFDREVLALTDSERVVSLAMTSAGLYVLVEGERGRRLRFIP